jgi:hypothetical protein
MMIIILKGGAARNIEAVSRTRCSAFSAVHRRAGTHLRMMFMDPGSAAHHAAKRGTLRSIRGTVR